MCGSPTVMLNVGFAACSTLTLGCVCLRGPSLLGGCTGGGIRGPDVGRSSSSRFTESIMLRREDCEVAVVGRGDRTEGCSFCGGAGGSSACEEAAMPSPKGPSGPRESSTAWRRVGCAPYRFTGLGARPVDREAELVPGGGSSCVCGVDCVSRCHQLERALRALKVASVPEVCDGSFSGALGEVVADGASAGLDERRCESQAVSSLLPLQGSSMMVIGRTP